ncbi:hypothetical protein DIPPA_56329, partial [Diplonema papillatum]
MCMTSALQSRRVFRASESDDRETLCRTEGIIRKLLCTAVKRDMARHPPERLESKTDSSLRARGVGGTMPRTAEMREAALTQRQRQIGAVRKAAVLEAELQERGAVVASERETRRNWSARHSQTVLSFAEAKKRRRVAEHE